MITTLEGSQVIDATERSLLTGSTTLTPQTDRCYLEAWVDFSRLGPADAYIVTLYETVGGTTTPLEEWPIAGVQAALFHLPPQMVGGGYQLTARLTAGTAREIDFGVTKETSTTISTTDASNVVDMDERSLVTSSEVLTAQTSKVYAQPWVDPLLMQSGDRYRLRVTRSVNGQAARPVFETVLEGIQRKLWSCPILLLGGGWNVTAQLLAGTPRTLRSSIRTDDRTASSPSYQQLASATTAEAIRDRIIEVIAGLVPTYDTENPFREFLNERDGNFVTWCERNATAAHRRYQVRDTGEDQPPEVSNTDFEERLVTFQILVAYPHSARYGADQALDRDDVMSQDQHQIEHAIGLHGAANFIAPHPQASWRGASTVRETGTNCDYLVITQTMAFYRQF